MAKLTTIGMYQYDPHLFDGLTFPAGIDKDIAISQILTRSGEFEVLYPNPTFYAQMITFWGQKHYRTFEKWVEGLAEPFNPLYNYDRFEEYVDEKTGTDSKVGKSSLAGTSAEATESAHEASSSENNVENVANTSNASTGTTGSRTATNTEAVTNSGDSENKISAFDSATYSPKEKTETSNDQSTNGTSAEVSGTDSTSSGSSETTSARGSSGSEAGKDTGSRTGVSSEERSDSENRTNAERIKHTAHLYGNIGVTTSAQMLREFLDVERFNIYEQIADIFIDEFCIMVY